MKLDMNPRGNGACPLCASEAGCRLRRLLGSSIEGEGDPAGSEMEIVIYSCPRFSEKVNP